jgi:hypothetical protein
VTVFGSQTLGIVAALPELPPLHIALSGEVALPRDPPRFPADDRLLPR